jgi:uncharacterized membrane protein YhhN
MTPALWFAAGALAALDWYAVAVGRRTLERWAKPATLVLLIVAVVSAGATNTTAGWFLVVALAFGLVGDVALLGDSTARFQAGLAAFLVGHLAYLVCFVTLGWESSTWGWIAVAVVLVAFGFARRVLPTTHRTDGVALSAPVAAYMLVIACMTVVAWGVHEPLIALGATVFVASDSTLAVNRFVSPLPAARVVIMVTYHLGQALMALGVIGALR